MKVRVLRVVTASFVVHWHLNNTLKRISDDFETCVVGQDVSLCQEAFPKIKFKDININRKTSLIEDILAFYSLCKFIIVYKPQIIHSIMPKAGFLASIAGFICRVPIRVHTFTGQTWVAKKGISSYLYYVLDLIINFLNTECLTDSNSQSDFLFENYIRHAGRPLKVLSKGSLSGVDISRFNLEVLLKDAHGLKEQLKIKDEDFVFSYLARKTKAKGALDILLAFHEISLIYPQVHLLFIGPDEDGLISDLKKTKPYLFHRVIELGHVDNPELYLAITNVLCLPSYREGFGSVVIDAAALGVPTIGSRIPGLNDSISDNETGILIKVGDTIELETKMKLMIEKPDLVEQMGYNAKNRVKQYFTADKLYQELKGFYSSCMINNFGSEVYKY
jgi:glycosyltransferase involved in cell wall biosynthesis